MSGTDERQMEMWHLENDVFALGTSQGDRSVFTAPAISCNRHRVPVEKKAGFERKFVEVRRFLEKYTEPYKAVSEGGLRKRMWMEI